MYWFFWVFKESGLKPNDSCLAGTNSVIMAFLLKEVFVITLVASALSFPRNNQFGK